MNGMNTSSKGKPVVYYVGVAKIWHWNDDPRYPVASLPVVLDHPRLGNCYDVRTSVVLHQYFDGTIETMNTIYKPVAQEPMGS
jgi:hypothetical protein